MSKVLTEEERKDILKRLEEMRRILVDDPDEETQNRSKLKETQK